MQNEQKRRAKLAEAEHGDSLTKKERVKLSDHFTYGKVCRFTIPSIIMTIFGSIYTIVDGFFVSNYAGSTALAAVNLSDRANCAMRTLSHGMRKRAMVAQCFIGEPELVLLDEPVEKLHYLGKLVVARPRRFDGRTNLVVKAILYEGP